MGFEIVQAVCLPKRIPFGEASAGNMEATSGERNRLST